MNIKYSETKNKKLTIPEIGDVWRHKDDSFLYLRIDPTSCIRVTNYDNERFYSVDLQIGGIVKTSKNADNCEVLNHTLTIHEEENK